VVVWFAKEYLWHDLYQVRAFLCRDVKKDNGVVVETVPCQQSLADFQ